MDSFEIELKLWLKRIHSHHTMTHAADECLLYGEEKFNEFKK